MKKVIPFKKELFFKNNIAEIVSISLEHTLHHEKDYLISGEFIISGEYRITDSSINTEVFDFKVPFDINIDEKYSLEHMIIDINDFYYEIANSNALNVNIEVLLDKLEENRCIDKDDIKEELKEHKEILEDLYEEHKEDIKDKIEDFITENKIEEKIEQTKEKIENKIDELSEKIKGYVTYRVYIYKEEDTLNSIIDKYKTSKEELEQYNILNDLKVGDKIIIPSND